MKTQIDTPTTQLSARPADLALMADHELAAATGGVVICYGPGPKTRPEPVTPPGGYIP